MPEAADFLTVEHADGRTWTYLSRLADGRVMCCLCFDYCTRDQLSVDPADGQVTDVCKPCTVADTEAANRRTEEETRDA